MIRVTFDCPDAEIAGFLSVLFVIYTQEDADMSLDFVKRELGPALAYLRDRLDDFVEEVGEDGFLINSDGRKDSQFSNDDWQTIRSLVYPTQPITDEKVTGDF